MSHRHWHWILEDPKLSSSEKLVLLAIVSYQHTDRAAPIRLTQARISKLTGLGIRTVVRAIAGAEEKGYRVISRRGAWHDPNSYLVRQDQGLLFSSRCGFPCAKRPSHKNRPATVAGLPASGRPQWPTEFRYYKDYGKEGKKGAQNRRSRSLRDLETRKELNAGRNYQQEALDELRRLAGRKSI